MQAFKALTVAIRGGTNAFIVAYREPCIKPGCLERHLNRYKEKHGSNAVEKFLDKNYKEKFEEYAMTLPINTNKIQKLNQLKLHFQNEEDRTVHAWLRTFRIDFIKAVPTAFVTWNCCYEHLNATFTSTVMVAVMTYVVCNFFQILYRDYKLEHALLQNNYAKYIVDSRLLEISKREIDEINLQEFNRAEALKRSKQLVEDAKVSL